MSVNGYDKAISKLDRILKGMSGAQQEAAQEWLEQDFLPLAKQIVPKDTGELMESIGGKVTATSVKVYATAGHARYVEEGTSTHAAQPYMRPAWEQTASRLKKRIADKLKRLR